MPLRFSYIRYSAVKEMLTHIKSRVEEYPRSNGSIKRIPVPDEKVSWDIPWEGYSPPYYTSQHIIKMNWADPEISDNSFKPKWNSLDGSVNRISHVKNYLVEYGYPLNPIGRTGLKGRGVLGRWGPNHAGDPVVTRWKRNADNQMIFDEVTEKPVLQFVGIKRRDNNEWAIPGGMVDPGEAVTTTLKREFLEEALNFLEMSSKKKEDITQLVNDFFSTGTEVHRGYVDDPRNTDNAWIETVVFNFHDEKGDFVGSLPFNAGDDAIGVVWLDVSKKLPLYASHSYFIELVTKKLNSHW